MDVSRLPQAEQDQYRQLLSKYRCSATPQERVSTTSGTQHPNEPQYQASEAISVCPKCQGSRVEVELYEYRQLERTCRECMGEGVCRTSSG
ncbi:hypothetical protein ABBQ32_008908 [Trebouxia sp. C0010 RCD-2024]